MPGDHSQVGWLPPSCVPYHYFENNSSPRGRGKQDQSPRTHPTPRLIPAWAEKTAAAPGPESQPRAHPRAGGENVAAASTWGGNAGSSPHGRGKRNQPRRAHPAGRLIPARAGKTSHGPDHRLASTAHPRAGGENDHENILTIPQKGSSPRGRGKPIDLARITERGGLIPARAEKTKKPDASAAITQAHPRAGGENQPYQARCATAPGSSPRGRGKQIGCLRSHAQGRLIPARAGKTRTRTSSTCPSRAHPRAGGENIYVDWATLSQAGSSPRGRGKQDTPMEARDAQGLIPARAGKTLSDLRFYRADRSDLGNP